MLFIGVSHTPIFYFFYFGFELDKYTLTHVVWIRYLYHNPFFILIRYTRLPLV